MSPRVKRRGPKFRRGGITPAERAVLRGEPCPPDGNPFSHLMMSSPGRDTEFQAQLREAWEYAREELLAEWIRESPGTRPPGWWLFDAPERRREGEEEAAYLDRLGLLTPEETD